jgi:uncharacterized protein with FMN-binding domain
MRRAPIVLAATAAGLAGVLGFHAHPRAVTPAAASASAITGEAVGTRYGNVQLAVTVSGGRLKSVQALQLPSLDPKSVQISSYAEPLLRQSALVKQSADVDVVSGATYTSDGYRTALQSTLDKAGFRAPTSVNG